MKKSIFILTALLAATFANAQITLEETLTNKEVMPLSTINNHMVSTINGYGFDKLPCPFYYTCLLVKEAEGEYWNNEWQMQFLNPNDLSVYKSINILEGDMGHIVAIAYDVFAVDKIAYIVNNNGVKIIDEDGNILLNLDDWEGENGVGKRIYVEKYGSEWKLFEIYGNNTRIYTCPGDGSMPQVAQAVSTPSSPKCSVRKIARDGQVIVQTDDHTYTLTGAEVK